MQDAYKYYINKLHTSHEGGQSTLKISRPEEPRDTPTMTKASSLPDVEYWATPVGLGPFGCLL